MDFADFCSVQKSILNIKRSLDCLIFESFAKYAAKYCNTDSDAGRDWIQPLSKATGTGAFCVDLLNPLKSSGDVKVVSPLSVAQSFDG